MPKKRNNEPQVSTDTSDVPEIVNVSAAGPTSQKEQYDFATDEEILKYFRRQLKQDQLQQLEEDLRPPENDFKNFRKKNKIHQVCSEVISAIPDNISVSSSNRGDNAANVLANLYQAVTTHLKQIPASILTQLGKPEKNRDGQKVSSPGTGFVRATFLIELQQHKMTLQKEIERSQKSRLHGVKSWIATFFHYKSTAEKKIKTIDKITTAVIRGEEPDQIMGLDGEKIVSGNNAGTNQQSNLKTLKFNEYDVSRINDGRLNDIIARYRGADVLPAGLVQTEININTESDLFQHRGMS